MGYSIKTGASWVRMVVNLKAGSHCPKRQNSWVGHFFISEWDGSFLTLFVFCLYQTSVSLLEDVRYVKPPWFDWILPLTTQGLFLHPITLYLSKKG